jgi:two-component system, LytTR family, sensor kinase
MPNLPSGHEPLLVNTVAHAAGSIIFGIFLFLLFRDYAASRLRGSWLSISATLLAFFWNLGSFIVLSAPGLATWQVNLLVALSFSSLSALPAILLHVSLNNRLRPVVLVGYTLSVIAVCLHFAELVKTAGEYHQRGLVLITVGFVGLTVIALVAIARTNSTGRRTTPRLLATMGLALFAISFVHFGSGHGLHPWSSELILHHAGIPAALFILLQDFRFVLLDAFIRFLANAFLAAIFTFVSYRVTARFLPLKLSMTPLQETVLWFSVCLLLIAFALVRPRVQRLLTRVVFRRSELEKTVQRIRALPASAGREKEYLDWSVQQVAEYVGTSAAELGTPDSLGNYASVLPLPLLATDLPHLRGSPEFRWVEAVVPLRFSKGDVQYILLGRRRGGRRYLSEDLQGLARLATLVVEQIEHFRESEMQRLVSQAELRALQSQINPHFLFNALNTLYGIIPREAQGARRTVLNLAEVFRYCLRSEKTYIPLSEELRIVNAYLEVEALRLGNRLHTEMDIDEQMLSFPIPILSIQPLVENAVKHGVSPHSRVGWVKVRVKNSGQHLNVSVEDSGGSFVHKDGSMDDEGAGVGLANVSRRLKLCYGAESELTIDSGPSSIPGKETTRVCFTVPLAKRA